MAKTTSTPLGDVAFQILAVYAAHAKPLSVGQVVQRLAQHIKKPVSFAVAHQTVKGFLSPDTPFLKHHDFVQGDAGRAVALYKITAAGRAAHDEKLEHLKTLAALPAALAETRLDDKTTTNAP